MEKAIALLAAGVGSRYGGLKQMDSIGPNGEFLIDYSVYDAIRAGFNKIIFIIRHDIEQQFKATIGKRIEDKVETLYTFQELDNIPRRIVFDPGRTKPWGTVQAVLTCAKFINSPFAVINADDFYGRESYKKLSKFLDTTPTNASNYCMVGFWLNHTLSKHGGVTRGICRLGQDNLLDNIVETPGITCTNSQIYFEEPEGNKVFLKPENIVSMNMWGFTPSIFKLFEEEFNLFLQSHAKELKSEFVIPTAVNLVIKKAIAAVKVLSTSSNWFGMTYPDDKDEAIIRIQQLIQSGEYPDNLWKETFS